MKRAGLIVFIGGNFLAGELKAADTKPSALPEALRAQAEGAQKYFAAGRWSDAERSYEAMRKAAPDNAWVLSNLAVVQMRLGKSKQAEETLRTALLLAPDDLVSRRILGLTCYAQQKYDDAIAELEKVVAMNPNDAEAHLYLAFCAAQKGLPERAEKEMGHAVRLKPEYKAEVRPSTNAGRHWPVGDFLTPLERSRLRLPPARVIR